MPNLRTAAIGLAATMPEDSPERKALLKVLASEPVPALVILKEITLALNEKGYAAELADSRGRVVRDPTQATSVTIDDERGRTLGYLTVIGGDGRRAVKYSTKNSGSISLIVDRVLQGREVESPNTATYPGGATHRQVEYLLNLVAKASRLSPVELDDYDLFELPQTVVEAQQLSAKDASELIDRLKSALS